MDFLKMVWNKYINPAVSYVWHIAGGAVIGALAPSVSSMTHQFLSGGVVDVRGDLSMSVSNLVGLGVGALVGWGQHSNNQVVAKIANSIPPDQVAVIDAKISTAVTNAITPKKAGMVLALLGLMAFGNLDAQTIMKYSGGLSLSSEAVTSKINGDFLILGIGGGVIPLSFNNGLLSWDSANTMLTVDYFYVKGSIEPSKTGGLELHPGWWLGPSFGAGLFQASNNSVEVTHGIAGLKEGADLGIFTLSLAEMFDLDTKNLYFGPAMTMPLDIGSASVVQVH